MIYAGITAKPDHVVEITFVHWFVFLSLSAVFWVGKVRDDSESSVYITYTNKALIGRILTKNEQYRIQLVNDNQYQIAQLAPDKMTEPENDASIPTDLKELDKQDIKACEDPTNEIDVMVIYTEPAEKGAGGAAGMDALIKQCIFLTNSCYTASKINSKVKLVHSEKVVYTETKDCERDRNALKNPSDGILDGIHALRNLYKADIVVLVIEEEATNSCGITYIFESLTSDFSPYAFAVVKRACSSDNLTFAHELGHIMGGRHNTDAGTTPYAYCHGYESTKYRTVMAYNTKPKGSETQREPVFSNPNIKFADGSACGIAGTSENYKVFNVTMPLISRFRCRK